MLVQANALNNILSEDYLKSAPTWPIWLGWLILGWATLAFLRNTPVLLAIGIPVLLIAVFAGINYLFFAEKSILVPFFWPSFGFAALHGGSVVNRLLKEMRAKGRIKAIDIKGQIGRTIAQNVFDFLGDSSRPAFVNGTCID